MLQDFFDDCPICQAQKRAIKEGRPMTMEEFIQASKEAEMLGASTGSMDTFPPIGV